MLPPSDHGLPRCVHHPASLIALVEYNLGPTEDHAKLTRTWKLPKKAKHPEGLLFLPDATPLVAIDSTSKKKNGFVLSPLD